MSPQTQFELFTQELTPVASVPPVGGSPKPVRKTSPGSAVEGLRHEPNLAAKAALRAKASGAESERHRKQNKRQSGQQRIESWIPGGVAEAIRSAAAAAKLTQSEIVSRALAKKFPGDTRTSKASV